MRASDIVKMAYNAISQRRTRAALNILGILVGITAVTALMSVTEGVSEGIGSEIDKIGSRTLIVLPVRISAGGTTGFSFSGGPSARMTTRDVTDVSRVLGVEQATPVISGNGRIKVGGVWMVKNVRGIVPEEYFRIDRSIEPADGRLLAYGDRVGAVVGADIASPPGSATPLAHVGSAIYIETTVSGETRSRVLRVSGVLEKVGGFTGQDDRVYVPYTVAQYLLNRAAEVDYIYAEASDIDQVDATAERIEEMLGGTTSVLTSNFLKSTSQQILAILQIMLAGVAGISLFVAGVGVANTQLISIMERIREIGIQKAVGATNSSILMMFLTESAIVGLVGGAVGTLLGFFVAQLIAYAAQLNGVPILIDLFGFVQTGIMGLIFALFVGIVAGLYPARKAANLNPVEALRYE